MKIIRYQDPRGTIGYASLLPGGEARKIQGDILGSFQVTDSRAEVARTLAPLSPAAILCIGLNYRQHATETNSPMPAHPILFIKNVAAAQDPDGPILLPSHRLKSTEVDYECELAVVIGRRCKNVGRDRALEHVLGYTCANDVSARDWQGKWGGSQWCRGKTFDTFAPLGPCLVTPEDIPNPNALRIRTILNGQTMQDSNTADMIFDVPALIEFLSSSTTLLPGTVILTGTPQGIGAARKPQVFLKAGDKITIEIEKIGSLTNPVQNETNLDGQVALVTGAGRGIGQCIGHALAANGAKVVYADVDFEAAQRSAAQSPSGLSLRLDVTSPAEIEAGIAQVERDCGRLDILVNNAGVNSGMEHRVNIDRFSPAEWDRVLKVDLTGVFLVSRAATQAMIRRKYGRIINISSVLGVIPARLQCAFTAAKAGVLNLTRAMAIELAPDGILVNAIAPGSMENVYAAGSGLKEFGQRILSHVPLGRPGKFDDIAQAALFFAAPENGYVTGQTLCVDGGWTAGGFFRDF